MTAENKKLISATISFDIVVSVDNDATNDVIQKVIRRHVIEAADDMSQDEFDISFELYNGTNAKGWDGICIPYGGDGSVRIKDYSK